MTTQFTRPAFERVSPELVERAKKFQSAILCDVFGRRGTLNARVQALNPAMQVAGPAFTVEVRPGDNLMFHVALALAQPGDVIIVDGKGDDTCALFGELMVSQAEAAGLAGFVVDAASRDTDTLADGKFPIFAAGRNPCGPTKGLGGTFCKPISVAGVPVQPGDLVLGDADGVVVIPRADVERVLQAAEKKQADEKVRLEEIARGELVSPWLHDALLAAGLPALPAA
ncbi:RraA family protein [Azohydromonas australica]|uniref:RraA family protein n=1 Tax=Azohydromonas australica TaxID=364039 RepID=UPI00040B0D4E|nr:diguanylate cyclase [Azohydromonas australica]